MLTDHIYDYITMSQILHIMLNNRIFHMTILDSILDGYFRKTCEVHQHIVGQHGGLCPDEREGLCPAVGRD